MPLCFVEVREVYEDSLANKLSTEQVTGNDVLDGGEGNDIIFGGAGNDTLNGTDSVNAGYEFENVQLNNSDLNSPLPQS